MGSTPETQNRPAGRGRHAPAALPGQTAYPDRLRPTSGGASCLSADPEKYTHGVTLYHPSKGYARHRVIYYDVNGKRRARGAGRSCDIARGTVAEVIAELEAGLAGHDGETVAQAVQSFLTDYHEHSSLRHGGEVRKRLEERVIPLIGHVPLVRLRRADVRAAIDGPEGDPHSKSLRQKLRTDLGPFLSWLEDQDKAARPRGELMPSKPPRTAKTREKRGPERQYIDPKDRPSPVDCGAIAEALRQVSARSRTVGYADRAWLLSALSSATGIRIGEAIALRARDVADFTSGELEVTRQVVTVPRVGDQPRQRVETLPKWGKARVTVLPRRTLWGEDLWRPLATLLETLDDDELLFPSPTGKWLDESNFSRDRFNGARLVAGGAWAVRWSWHQHRHAFASALIARGASIADVSRLLGHETVTTTINMYVGATAGATERVGRLF